MDQKDSRKDGAFRTNIGGQALIEGIMMRGPDKVAAVARRPDGTLAVQEQPYIPLKERNALLGLPVVRGAASLVVSLAVGMKTLMWAAEQVLEEETPEDADSPPETPEPPEPRDPSAGAKTAKAKKSDTGLLVISLLLGLVLAVGLFTVLPTFLGGLIARWTGDGFLRNLLETLLRVLILVGYMLAVSQMKDIKRVFAYHGAEHKTIACYEAGQPLTPENVKRFPRFHPRCGTSFLLMVLLVSLVAFMLVGLVLTRWVDLGHPLIRVATRLAILPFVAGIAYEINRFIGAHDNGFTRFLRAPGLWLQRITTKEPDGDMIAVGIDALSRVIPAKQADAEWGRE
ncbi:MAG: DUF1385 domain-containing protein [Oscillospiraceae bacterium]|nr:DUF1385 domain-containing protein [Oscillospiraceae bacterium]